MFPRTLARLAFFASLLCAISVAAAPPEIVVVVEAKNEVKSLSAAQLEAIFTSRRLAWADDTPVVPFNLPPGDPVRVAFDKAVLGFDPDQAGRYWVDQRIRGGPRAPRQVADATLVSRLVGRLRGAIGYLPADKVLPGVRIVARIRDGKVISP